MGSLSLSFCFSEKRGWSFALEQCLGGQHLVSRPLPGCSRTARAGIQESEGVNVRVSSLLSAPEHILNFSKSPSVYQ